MHIIRLRGPWELEPVSRLVLRPDGAHCSTSSDLPSATRVKMPADWGEVLGRHFFGRVRYRRTFQKPTGLESGERVWLVVEPPRSHGVVELNHKRLGEVCGQSARFDITEQLLGSNLLDIWVSHPPLDVRGTPSDDGDTPPGGLVGEVRLEIEEPNRKP